MNAAPWTSAGSVGARPRQRQRRLRNHGTVERLFERLDQFVLGIGLEIEAVRRLGRAHKVHDAVPAGPGEAVIAEGDDVDREPRGLCKQLTGEIARIAPASLLAV